MIKFLLDTNICIYIIKKRPQSVYQRFQILVPGEVAISSITLAEMHYGIQKSTKPTQNLQALHQFLLPLEVIDFDTKAARAYGQIRSQLEKEGQPIGALDMLIAAHAKSMEVTLVSNNLKEFSRVKDLKTENWVMPGT